MKQVLGALLLLLLLGQVDVQIISPILPELSDFFDVNIASVGSAVTVYSVVGAIWALIIGPLADRFGRLLFLQLAAAVMAGACAMAYLADLFPIFLLSRGIAGIAGATISVCIIAQIADMFPFEKRGKAMGFVGAIYAVAAVGGAPIGAIIAGKYGWPMLYAVAFFVSLFLAASMYFAAGKQMRPLKKSGQEKKQTVKQRLLQPLKEYRLFIIHSNTRNGLILAVMISATATAVITYLGAWFVRDFSMKTEEMAPVYLSLGGSTIIGSLFGGWLSDKIGKQMLVGLGSIFLAMVLFCSIFVSNFIGIYGFCVGGGFIIAMREGPYQALITELVKAEERGAYIALKSTAAKTGIAVAASFGGFLFEQFGFFAVANFAGICSLTAGFIVFRALKISDLQTDKAIAH